MLNLRRPDPSDFALSEISHFHANQSGKPPLGHTYLGDLGAEMDIDNLNDRTHRRDAKQIVPRHVEVWVQSEEETELELNTVSQPRR